MQSDHDGKAAEATKVQLAQFKRDLIRELQREGIALAKQRKVYLGRALSLSTAQAADLRQRVLSGEGKALLAQSLGFHARRFTNTWEGK